ncbi:efflux RND transporter periplasmic adaptor subunit [Pseudoduganella umbonata]|uniref:Efflux RND transporter periplasmic adaptor subunit n=1 Tax=Pseudoduganella umbonata TaxID=864828 RepID=A0A4V1EDR0_9BURK|nr:efflux RND transporter periplasmic adaptor subunit [Pseudoduganella umbonata]MBB3220537.1 multidrug efflux system membrane fusion protein [Pseudoduganella umbonata]QCP11951.1 efflux RND transporter periplasmic adaptor subunit [Pseudoduganella umbonata]
MNSQQRGRPGLKKMLGALAAAGMCAAAVSGCTDANSKTEPPAASAGPPVSAAVVVERPVAETQEFSGRLEAIEVVQIRPRVSGYITAVNFTPGAEVKKGTLLFVIDPRPYQAEADRAQAAANSARARADLARIELQRAERLLADKAIAQREFDERAAGQKELEANARAAQAQLDAARLNLSYTRVTAPIDGRISKAEITLGNLVDATAVLTSVVSLDRMYASFDGDEQTYLRVGSRAQRGQPTVVKVGLNNEDGYPHEGVLEFVDNQLDTQTGSVRMRATLNNADRVLAPGLFARIQVGSGVAQNAILIRDKAVGTDQSRKFVVVVGPDNKTAVRQVTLGPLADGMRVVRSGLKPGEKIIVDGLQRVTPGAAVSAQLVPMDEAAARAAKLAGASRDMPLASANGNEE